MGAFEYNVTPPCANPTSGGTISTDQTICSGFAPAAFASTALPVGQNGTLEYKWQKSTSSGSGGFADIISSNSATYAPGFLNATTWYKRLARVACMVDWTGAAESNALQITVNQPTFTAPAKTLTDLVVTGTNIKWYAASSGGTELASTTQLVSGAHYYASQTVNGCESPTRFDVIATLDPTPCAPTGATLQTYSSGATVTSLTATGANIRWYATSIGGTELAGSTILINGTHYWATQTVSCTESATRMEVTVTIN
jgi:hypothetical protein